MLDDVLSAFTLLTRLPAWRLRRRAEPLVLARAVWAFPVVGLAVGGIGGAVYWFAHRLGMPPLLAAGWTLIASVLVTGALHEDGLADVADGFGGGRTAARKLEIMRDSRIGAYGTLALLFSLLLRASAIMALRRPALVAAALIVAGVVGRSGMIVVLLALKPARPDGLASAFRDLPRRSAVFGMVLAVLVAAISLPAGVAVITLLMAVVACLVVIWVAKNQIGGHTGDVLGAGDLVIECVSLSVIAACLSGG